MIWGRIEDLKGYQQLKELALDLQWPWSHYGDKVRRLLDAELWDITIILGGSSRQFQGKACKAPRRSRILQVINGLVKIKSGRQRWKPGIKGLIRNGP